MGVLYLARDPLLERSVAIKMFTVHNAELAQRFAREARSAAGLKHPNIVTIYDVVEDSGAPSSVWSTWRAHNRRPCSSRPWGAQADAVLVGKGRSGRCTTAPGLPTPAC
jgi:serine/threonine protein kinase